MEYRNIPDCDGIWHNIKNTTEQVKSIFNTGSFSFIFEKKTGNIQKTDANPNATQTALYPPK
ncbi:hypothetical protein ATR1_073c0026 [Acetobacter tropicalis]|uniref:Uncharacterized protein n=1 Tax=Acetobacter tropicalis TaxID=104102 RepID=A0A511FLQ6_9PROT|nr:hypothetical protein ATR1_073c0026 [Acetobacter tropicalis]GEL50171.1 hypothetical protein ATR01nite_12460 [Acetobacter tropicalis]